MAVENETAEQVVKMVLQGTEVVLRVSGEAAINVIKMIYTVLKNDRLLLLDYCREGRFSLVKDY